MLKNSIRNLINKDIKVEDSVVEFSILESKDYIMNYCNITAIPKGLDLTILKMSADIINFDNTEVAEIKSLSQGDTSITFNTSISKREDIFKSYNKTLNKFRDVRK